MELEDYKQVSDLLNKYYSYLDGDEYCLKSIICQLLSEINIDLDLNFSKK